MNKLLAILVCTVLLASVKGAFCGTYDLTRLLDSREFWASYTWDKYTDSPLYGSATWKPSGMSLRGDVKISEGYMTEVVINDLPVRELRMEVDVATGNVTSFVIGSYNFTTDAYRVFVDWCTGRFGKADKEEEQSENQGAVTRTTVESAWEINDTLITVTTVKRVRNEPTAVPSIDTRLMFARNYRPQGVAATGTSSGNPHVPDKETPIAASRAQRHAGGEVSASPSTTARAGNAVRVVPSLPRVPAATAPGSAEKSVVQRYQPPPYIWESANGAMMAVNDISDVPVEIRRQFELKQSK